MVNTPTANEPDAVAVAAQAVAGLTAGPLGFEQPPQVGHGHAEVPGGPHRVETRPEQVHRLFPAQHRTQHEQAQQLTNPRAPQFRRLHRDTVPRHPHRPDDPDTERVFRRRRQRGEQSCRTDGRLTGHPSEISKPAVHLGSHLVGQPPTQPQTPGSGQASGQFDRPRQRQEAQRVRFRQFRGRREITFAGSHQRTPGRPRHPVRRT